MLISWSSILDAGWCWKGSFRAVLAALFFNLVLYNSVFWMFNGSAIWFWVWVILLEFLVWVSPLDNLWCSVCWMLEWSIDCCYKVSLLSPGDGWFSHISLLRYGSKLEQLVGYLRLFCGLDWITLYTVLGWGCWELLLNIQCWFRMLFGAIYPWVLGRTGPSMHSMASCV